MLQMLKTMLQMMNLIGCDGIIPTVELLSMLNDKDQVLEYAEWVLGKNPDQAVRIFAERCDFD